MIKKNTAGQFIYFGLVSTTDGSAVTGASPTGYVSIDASAQTGMGGSITELANGQYKMVLSQGDTNGDEVGYFITSTGAIPVSITVTTETKKMADLNDLAAGALMGLVADAITSSKFDETSAWPLLAEDTGSSQIARVGADGDTLESLSDEIAALPTDADVNAQCDLALSDIHLDHLLAVDFNADSPVGHTTSFLRQMVEADTSLVRFTEAAVANAPGATGDATEAKQDLILEDIVDMKGTAFAKDTNSLVDLAKATDIPDTAAIETAVDASMVTYQLDHLLHTAYAGTAAGGSIMDDLLESDAGDYRFQEHALTEAPSGTGGDASDANQVLLLEDIADLKGTAFSKNTDSMVNLAHIGNDADTLEVISDEIAVIASSLATTDGKVDDIVTAVETDLDAKLDTIITAVGTTLDGKVDDIDTLCTFIQDVLEGDQEINTATTPWRHLIKRVDGGATLVEKELFQLDDSDITASTQIVGNEIEPV